jgi:membrane-bound lytic murein transglycosylase D
MFRDEEQANLWELRERIKKNVPDPRTSRQFVYRVKSGDNLGSISGQFGVSVAKIKTWNNLRTDVIYIGQKLTVFQETTSAQTNAAKKSTAIATANAPSHVPEQQIKTVQEEIPKDESVSQQKESVNLNDYLTYTVKSGETLYGIARSFPGVSAENIMEWNNASADLKVGQKLKIKKSEIRK